MGSTKVFGHASTNADTIAGFDENVDILDEHEKIYHFLRNRIHCQTECRKTQAFSDENAFAVMLNFRVLNIFAGKVDNL